MNLYNPFGSDAIKDRKLIGGNSTGLINLCNVKYNWGPELYKVMMANFWIPQKVDLTSDVIDYKELSVAERRAYNGILSFLVFLDSLQTNNLPSISQYVTAPEVSMLIHIQDFQEVVHSVSYAYLIETVIPSDERNAVYEFWRNDEVLYERNNYVASVYQKLIDNPDDPKALWKSIVANYLLEGLYFYNGFAFFYNLASRSRCIATADMIRYINRDEFSHCILFAHMINTIKAEHPELYDEEVLIEMTRIAVEQEISWTNHILGNEILGVNAYSTDQYTKYLANERLKVLGIKPIYEGIDVNPYAHLENIADEKGEAYVRANFFESTVTTYSQSSAIEDGW
jgi:ribonucleoside-diphosphate reductase beta chain